MSTNTTDYDLPEVWGLMSPEERSLWFFEERSYRQALRQGTLAPSLIRRPDEGDV